MSQNVKPIGDRILVEAVEEKDIPDKKGGIIIPDTAKEKPMTSKVVALGTGRTDDNGKKVPEFSEIRSSSAAVPSLPDEAPLRGDA